MTYDKFVELVKKMRKAQRDYFATRDRCILDDSKRLERQVDKVIVNNEVGQDDLFDNMKGE